MKKTVALLAVVMALGSTFALDAQAKRLGGGKSVGMQRSTATQPAQTPPGATSTPTGSPAQAAPVAGTAAAAAAPAAAAATKRSWLGPVAGIAAGLGIAALASHFGFGEALANMLTMALIAMAVLFVIGFFMRKRMQGQGQQPAYAGAHQQGQQGTQQSPFMLRSGNEDPGQQRPGGSLIGSRLIGGVASTQAGYVPQDFDTASFERNARDQFMALQAANDARDLDRLRDYLTPEMFDVVRAEIAERGDVSQKTEVFGLNARVLEVAEDATHYVVSVRFTASVRDQVGADTEDLDEVWHLTKPRTGFGGWVIAGIQQVPRQ